MRAVGEGLIVKQTVHRIRGVNRRASSLQRVMRRIAGESADHDIVAYAQLRLGDEHLLFIAGCLRLQFKAIGQRCLTLGGLGRARSILDEVAGELDNDVGIGTAVAIAAAFAVG